MCSVCPPPSPPSPNWGGLTSWTQLNWVVVPVASVSFPVSQGGLHSHCARHCIVQTGCNQADESRISRNTLRVFFVHEKCCEVPTQEPHKNSQSTAQKSASVCLCKPAAHTFHYSLTQELLWWISTGPSCWVCHVLLHKSLVSAVVIFHCLLTWWASVFVNLVSSGTLCIFVFVCAASCLAKKK